MRKRFNVDGICYPEEHYMVNVDDRLDMKPLWEYGCREAKRWGCI